MATRSGRVGASGVTLRVVTPVSRYAARRWLLANIAPIKTPTLDSYRMKHVVERAIGEYVTNGDLIAAALMAGYPMSRPHGPNEPNAEFGTSKRATSAAIAKASPSSAHHEKE